MKNLLLCFLLVPFVLIGQTINKVDEYGKKQGLWLKKHKNGNLRYKGEFKDDKPQGLFFHYYKSGELQVEKEYFHNGKAVATHFFYKDGVCLFPSTIVRVLLFIPYSGSLCPETGFAPTLG